MQLRELACLKEFQNAIGLYAPQMGYSAQVIQIGFEAMFSHWNDAEFLNFIKNEIPGFDKRLFQSFLDIDLSFEDRRSLMPCPCSERIFLVSASTVPSAAFQDVLLTLLLPVHLIHMPSHAQSDFFKSIQAWLMSRAPRLVERWELIEPTYDEQYLSGIMADCDALNISASQKTIEHFRALRDRLPVEKRPQKWIEHGHKVSAIVLFKEDLDTLTDADLEAIAWDASIWDQTGCLSPKSIVMECSCEDARYFAQKIIIALDKVADKLPELKPETSDLAVKNNALIMAELDGCTVMHASKNHDSLIIHPDGGFPVLLPRTLNLFPVQDVLKECMRISMNGQALGSKKTLSESEKKVFSQAGYHVFCDLGQMQNPPLTWFHDNIGTL
ncbi:MAG: hypothetical protein J6A01_10535, partial [Proteobacteria bacterium]|nr:hypothetical protein [Pseudomonadota bacterium]